MKVSAQLRLCNPVSATLLSLIILKLYSSVSVCPLLPPFSTNCLMLYISLAFFVNMAGFTKDACASLLLGQVWYEQLTDKSKLYLKQLNKEIVEGVSKYDIQYRVLLKN